MVTTGDPQAIPQHPENTIKTQLAQLLSEPRVGQIQCWEFGAEAISELHRRQRIHASGTACED